MSEAADKSTEALLNEAVACMRNQDYVRAIELTNQILQTAPNDAVASAVNFNCLFKSRRFDSALKAGDRAAELNPRSEFILHNLACLQLDAGQAEAAIRLLNSLIHEFGERAAWFYNLGLAYNLQDRHDQAIEHFQRTLDAKPDHDKAVFQLGASLQTIGQWDRTVEVQNYLRLLRPNHSPSHSHYMHNATVISALSLQELKQEMNLWGERFIPREGDYPVEPVKHRKRVKLGFLLGELPHSWLEAMVGPLVNELAGGDDTVKVYHDQRVDTPRIFDENVHTIAVSELTDVDFARQIRKDRIEVLVDVCGMRPGERQRALGLQIASYQFGWLAHEGIYASLRVTPVDEKLGQWPFFIDLEKAPRADKAIPADFIAALGCERGIANLVVRTWAEILFRYTGHTLHFVGTIDPAIVATISSQFNTFGIGSERLSFGAQYRLTKNCVAVDNFLDNDVAAVAYALNAGASVIALRGALFPAQQTAKLLAQVERDDWIASDRINYIGKILRMIRKHKVRPLSKAELKRSNLRDLQWFTSRFRKVLMQQASK